MTRTLSSGVGFDGSIPRKERKDFPDCGCAIFVFLSVFSLFFLLRYGYIYNETKVSMSDER